MTASVPSTPENRQRGAFLLWGFLFGVGVSALLDASGFVSVDVLFPEVFGIVITVGVLGWLNNRRAQRDLEAQLMRRIRSSVRDVAVAAIEELRFLGYFDQDKGTFKGMNLSGVKWTEARLGGANLQRADLGCADLQEASLVHTNLAGANLVFANLQRADLWRAGLQGAVIVEANLQGARLMGANLKEANLRTANLQRAALMGANLQRAELAGANLQGAYLGHSNLRGANLRHANLRGVRLGGADLQGAYLEDVIFDETTMLPDRTYWRPGIDMARFTDPNHPAFWRSDDPTSPAYRGDGE